MHEFLLGTTELGKVALAHVGGKDTIDSFAELIGIVRAECGDAVAALFSEPVRGPARSSKTPVVTWYAALEGSPTPLSQLDGIEKARVSNLLRERLALFSKLFSSNASGPTFASWLNLRSPEDILCIAGQPVLINWGMVPAAQGESSAMRESHFGGILGDLYPVDLPTPPFADSDAASFESKLKRLRLAPEPAKMATSTFASQAGNPSSMPTLASARQPAVAARPWLAPLVAVCIAAVILASINLFHMLRYPDALNETLASERLDAQRQTNRALEDRLVQLQQATAKVCLAPDHPNLLPPSPERTIVPTQPRMGQSQPGSTTIADLIDKATVLIINDKTSGSGFFISERNIVTNHHVIGDATQVKVGNRSLGGFVDARVVAVGDGRSNGTQDLAVLEVEPSAGASVLRIGVTPQRLRPVMAAGFPGAVLSTIDVRRTDQLPEANISSGMVTSRQVQQPGGVGAIVHTAQIGHGNSGGPLVDEGACAVGVNSWLSLDAERGRSFQTYNESLDAEELRKFLDSRNIPYVKADGECEPSTPSVAEAPGPRAGAK